VQEYHRALHLFDPSIPPTFGSLEGYISTRILLLALEKITGDLTRESIMNGLEDLGQFDLGLSVPLKISRTEHQASHQIWPTIIRNGEVLPFDWNQLKTLP
jgi:hypothetical protein